MKRERILGALFFVVVIIGLFLYLREGNEDKEIELAEIEKSGVEEMAAELSSKLGVTISEDVEKITLVDVKGEGASGLATRDYSDGKFVHSILAALPESVGGSIYQAWLARGSEGDEDYLILRTGKLRQSKGGFMLDYSSDSDLTDYNQVLVTSEKEDDDKPESVVLQGEF